MVVETKLRAFLLDSDLPMQQDMDILQLLRAVVQLKYTEHRLSVERVKQLNISLNEFENNHPITILQRENNRFKSLIDQMDHCFYEDHFDKEALEPLLKDYGSIYSHFNRKEKLIFIILERYGNYTMPRQMWAVDDEVRQHYGALKKRIQHDGMEYRHIKKTWEALKETHLELMDEEHYILLPLMQYFFNETDFKSIADESYAFGFAVDVDYDRPKRLKEELNDTDHLTFGGGYLTQHEANAILNALPMELTFVDRNGLFKYFNEITEATDMIFIRTPLSIGRNAANCHPPKSLTRVMQIMRDLRDKKKASETMWFKKGNQFVHVTYKAVFDDNDEYLGVLEYVQDIQPFMDLKSPVRK